MERKRAVRLHITMDEVVYRRLKKRLPPKGISAFIGDAVRVRLGPDRTALDAAYAAASQEAWRRGLALEWASTETEGCDWPEEFRRCLGGWHEAIPRPSQRPILRLRDPFS